MERIMKLPNAAKASILIGGSLLIMGTSWLLNKEPSENNHKRVKKRAKRAANAQSTNNTNSSCFSENYDKYSDELPTERFNREKAKPRIKKKVFLTDNEDFSSVNENFDEFKERIHSKIFNNSSGVQE